MDAKLIAHYFPTYGDPMDLPWDLFDELRDGCDEVQAFKNGDFSSVAGNRRQDVIEGLLG